MANQRQQRSGGSIIGIVGILIVVFIMYMLLSTLIGAGLWIWKTLFWITPIFLFLGFLFDSETILNFGSKLVSRFKSTKKRNIGMGIASLLGFPFIAPFLFFNAMTARNLKKQQKGHVKNKKKGEDYVEFEDVDDDDFLELEDLNEVKQKQAEKKPLDRYDDLFSE